MPWHGTAPEGNKSVRFNKNVLQDNTTYIETVMGNSIVGTNLAATEDHFWNVDSALDGHHRFMKSPKFTVGASPADPVIGGSIDQVIYAKQKTPTESSFQQDVQPFARNATAIMQLLGIRACVVFTGRDSNGSATIVYSHNVDTVTRTAAGKYTVAYLTALPSENYLVLGGGIRNSATATAELIFSLNGGVTVGAAKNVSGLFSNYKSDGGTFHDPLQGWMVAFGG